MSLRILTISLLLLPLALSSCNTTTLVSPTTSLDTAFVRRTLPAAVTARMAVAYSGYRTGQSPEDNIFPSESEILEDLTILAQGGFGYLRIFDCGTHAERVLKVIAGQHLDFKVQQGIWIAGPAAQFDSLNHSQIAKGILLANTYPDIIAAVSVGNETLDDWSSVRTPAGELAAYIKDVRAAVMQPVTTDDMWLPFTFGSDGSTSYDTVAQVAAAIDFLSVHIYAFLDAPWDSWDWQQLNIAAGPARAQAMMSAAIAYTKTSPDVHSALSAKGLDMPIMIGEAGWRDTIKTSPFNFPADSPEDSIGWHMADQINQKIFYDSLMNWVYGSGKTVESPIGAFYFEAFDEPWKDNDDNWGLFTVDRKAKYVMWENYPGLIPAGATVFNDSDAVYFGKIRQ